MADKLIYVWATNGTSERDLKPPEGLKPIPVPDDQFEAMRRMFKELQRRGW